MIKNKYWNALLSSEFDKEYYLKLDSFLDEAYNKVNVFPQRNDVFKAFESCDFDNLKVVIIGQDPYPTKGHAHGLCFSVKEDVSPLPKSLINVFKELSDDLKIPQPANGNLEQWANQGVLLLNNVLTVEEGLADSHSGKGWEQFTDRVLELINDKKENVVFLLWGKKAQTKGSKIDDSRHCILKTVHPSPLSVYRGFYGCKHFSKTNEYLKKHALKEIEW